MPESHFRYDSRDEDKAYILTLYEIKMWVLQDLLEDPICAIKPEFSGIFGWLPNITKMPEIWKKGGKGTLKIKTILQDLKMLATCFPSWLKVFFFKQILQCIKLTIAEVEIHIRQKWIDLPEVS